MSEQLAEEQKYKLKQAEPVLSSYCEQTEAASAACPQIADCPPYKLEEELGRGGMGVVYKAKREGVDGSLAVKKLHPRYALDETSLKRFKQEVEATSLLSHPNLVSLLDSGLSSAGEPYLVMDCINGRSLSQILAEKITLSQEEFLHIFRQVADALIHAHTKKLIHADLKPSNIMIQEESSDLKVGLVKLVDFGIAKLFPELQNKAGRTSQTAELLGSPIYMSPEQCLGEAMDERSDIYSLGCVMYEALTGRPPFLEENSVLTILGHINESPPSFVEIQPGTNIPLGLEKLVLKCLEKNPEKRFQSMQELADHLELEGKEVGSPRKKVLKTFYERSRFRQGLEKKAKILAVLISLTLLGAYFAIKYSQNTSTDDLKARTQRILLEDQVSSSELPIHMQPEGNAARQERVRQLSSLINEQKTHPENWHQLHSLVLAYLNVLANTETFDRPSASNHKESPTAKSSAYQKLAASESGLDKLLNLERALLLDPQNYDLSTELENEISAFATQFKKASQAEAESAGIKMKEAFVQGDLAKAFVLSKILIKSNQTGKENNFYHWLAKESETSLSSGWQMDPHPKHDRELLTKAKEAIDAYAKVEQDVKSLATGKNLGTSSFFLDNLPVAEIEFALGNYDNAKEALNAELEGGPINLDGTLRKLPANGRFVRSTADLSILGEDLQMLAKLGRWKEVEIKVKAVERLTKSPNKILEPFSHNQSDPINFMFSYSQMLDQAGKRKQAAEVRKEIISLATYDFSVPQTLKKWKDLNLRPTVRKLY